MNIDRVISNSNILSDFPDRDTEVAKWVYEGLKPLRAACKTPDTYFLAYLIEMAQTEAHRILSDCPEEDEDQ